jgi:hypothetical protein
MKTVLEIGSGSEVGTKVPVVVGRPLRIGRTSKANHASPDDKAFPASTSPSSSRRRAATSSTSTAATALSSMALASKKAGGRSSPLDQRGCSNPLWFSKGARGRLCFFLPLQPLRVPFTPPPARTSRLIILFSNLGLRFPESGWGPEVPAI